MPDDTDQNPIPTFFLTSKDGANYIQAVLPNPLSLRVENYSTGNSIYKNSFPLSYDLAPGGADGR